MRGKLLSSYFILRNGRLIPAHAGKTIANRQIRELCDGSSPRMRGKRNVNFSAVHESGLIPAHAGKTPRRLRIDVRRGAHPRACGENMPRSERALRERGSSPRMRGKHVVKLAADLESRLIPAHAGKTSYIRRYGNQSGAHPRACGENLFIDGDGVRLEGSSPRMRGKRTLTAITAL